MFGFYPKNRTLRQNQWCYLYRAVDKTGQTIDFLLNVVEQGHRAVKRVTRPMLGFKSSEAAQYTLAGIELMHMVKKGQLGGEKGVEGLTPADQFYALAA
jgi:putative transposase